jgi:thymidylate synthase
MMNNIDKQYQKLLQDIIDNGVEKKDRTGTGTISVFGRQIRHKMSEGFPLLTTKKMAWKTMVTELIWFLRGDTNIKYLVDNGCHIWDGDAYKNYKSSNPDILANDEMLKTERGTYKFFTQEEFINKIKTDDEFAKKWGELGPVYGEQWRDWKGFHEGQHDILKVVYGTEGREHYLVGIDQIQNLIIDLKTNPDSRRLMVNAWNVGELDQMVLPPCHYGFQVYTRELNLDERIDYFNKTRDPLNRSSDYHHVHMDSLRVPKRAISLMWNQRSVDTFLGLPFNIASYGLLLEIIAKEVNMVPDELVGNLGDVHLYSNHIEQAKEQIGRKYSHEEREEMLKNAMGPNGYEMAIKDLAPFGGGMSEYYEIYKIPYRTREPYKLPTLNISRTLFEHGKPNPTKLDLDYYSIHNFELLNYESHPTIKAPLSN